MVLENEQLWHSSVMGVDMKAQLPPLAPDLIANNKKMDECSK